MAILNITYNGVSADCPVELEVSVSDADVRRIAVELVRSGGVPGLYIADLQAGAFNNHVVDRFGDGAQARLFLRPKVPFGS
jgi:hypothetical protein